MKLEVFIDGGSRGNPGPAAAGVVIRVASPPKTLLEAGYFLGRATNNVAEYRGLLRAIEAVNKLGAEEVTIHSDSELMVNQITGAYRVKSPDLLPLYEQAQAMLLRLDNWQIRHVYRAANRRADELVNLALDAGGDVILSGGKAAPPSGALAESGATAASERPTPAARGEAEHSSWNASLREEPGKECPLPRPPRRAVVFGPATPAGFCVFAAHAVLEEITRQSRDPSHVGTSTTCERCGVEIHLEPGGSESPTTGAKRVRR